MSQLKQPPELHFDDTTDLSERWRRWRQTTQLYLDLSMAGKPEKEKCSVFLYVIGLEGREIYNTFTFAEGEKDKIGSLFAKFEDYCNPKKNVIVERHKFNTKYQMKSQSIDQYVTELRLITRNCEFGNLTEELIRDRIVCGTNSEQVKLRLLREDKLTLKSALSICRAEEESKKQMKNLNEESASDVHSLRQKKSVNRNSVYANNNNTINRSMPNRSSDRGKSVSYTKGKRNSRNNFVFKCKKCATDHPKRQCPAFGKICNKCRKTNHFAVCCRSDMNIHGLQEDYSESDEESDGEDFFIGAIHDKNKPHIESDECFVKLSIHKAEVKFKIDTGSQANVLPLKTFDKLDTTGVEKQYSRNTLTSYTGNRLPVKFKCKLTINNKLFDFYVTETDQPPLLGLHTSQELGLIKIVMSMNCSSEFIIDKYPSVFTGLGCLDKPYHIDIDETVKPVINPTRKVPVALRDKLKSTLQDMEKKDVIRKVDHPTEWVNSLVIVEKPKTGQLRVCLDPRHLNAAIKREHLDLPTIEDITTRMHNARVFAKLDANKAFYQIPLDEPSQLLTTFNTPFGRYCFLRMPFGIKSAQEVFQKRVAEHFGSMPGVETDIDDILVWATSEDELETRLDAVLNKCEQIKLTLNREKCVFKTEEVAYIGHVLTPDGIKPDNDKIKAIVEMPAPKDKKGVERLLGTVNYLAKFLPNMSTITQPIRNLLQKDVEFQWSENQERAFSEIKEILTSEPGPVLTFFNVKEPVTVSCDASQCGLGSVLLQNGRPIAYASRSMTPAETRYAQIEKELLSILFALERFHQYTYAKNVFVENDHKPLESIIKKPLASAPPRLQRMLLRLQKYTFDLRYKPGKQLVVADTLSRAPLPECESTENMEEELSYFVHTLIQNLPISDKKLQEIKELTSIEMGDLCDNIVKGWPEDKWKLNKECGDFWAHRDELSVNDGLIMKGERIVIPPSMRSEMLKNIHIGHMGIEKCRKRARDIIFWPCMGKQIADLVSKCAICLENRNSIQKEPLIPSEIPNRPWEIVATDLFTWNDSDYLVIVDYYSKYFEFAKLENTKSSTVIMHTKSIFARHGIPVQVKSDNGPQYTSKEYKDFSRNWCFEHTTMSPYHSQANGLVEKSVQTIKRMLTKSKHDEIDPYLGLLEYRNTPMDNLGSPAQLLMGRRLRSILPTSNKQLSPKTIKPRRVRKKTKAKQNYQRHYYDKGSKPLPNLEKGDVVRIQQRGLWKPAIVENSAQTPRSYNVRTSDGSVYRRNRRYIMKTSEKPFVPQNNFPDMNKPTISGNDHSTTEVVKDIQPNNSTVKPESVTQDREIRTTTSGRVVKRPVKFDDYVT